METKTIKLQRRSAANDYFKYILCNSTGYLCFNKIQKLKEKENDMCDLVSWIEADRCGRKIVIFLDDDDVFNTQRGKALQKHSGNNKDYTGHGAIQHYYDLKKALNLEQREETDFSSPKNFPKEIADAIKAGNFARVSQGDADAFDSVICMLNQNAKRKIKKSCPKYYEELIDTIEFDDKDDSPMAIKKEEVKEKLKLIFSEPDNIEYCSSDGYDLLCFFSWNDTDEGYDYWDEVNDNLKSDREIKGLYQCPRLEQFWELFKNRKNRIKAWR